MVFNALFGRSIATPTPIGEGEEPGAAAEGTLLRVIEAAVEKHVKAEPSISSRHMHDIIKDFPLMENRDVCKFYLADCMRYFSRAPDDGSSSGRSTVASRENAEDRSAVLSTKSFRTTPPTSAEGEQPSTLALDDVENNIEILLPNDVSKPVKSTLRNGEQSYISPRILKRFFLHADSVTAKVSIDLRLTVVHENRGRSYRVLNCSFRVRDDLEPDLAIGSKVLEQLKRRAGSTEESWNPDESTDDAAFGHGSRRAISRDANTSSHAGSSTRSSGGPATSKDYIDLLHRFVDMDTGVYGNRRNEHDDLRPKSPERPSRSRRR